MYKLIIADDEYEVRRGIIEKLDFEALGFELVGEAENGVDALELVETYNPDLAIIDIKMPYMDGIELAEHVFEKYPAMKVIIVSGFDEFEYAQKAIRLNVIEYVLKPVSSADIIKILEETKMLMDEERHKKQDLATLEKHYLESLPIISNRFLNALVLEKHSIKNLEDKIRRFRIEIGSRDFLVAVVRPDKSKVMDEKVYDLYAYSVFVTCRDLVNDDGITCFQSNNGDTVMILSEESKMKNRQILEGIRSNIEKNHIHTVTIGLGEVVKTIDLISDSYRGAVQALSYKILEGGNKVLWIEDLEPRRLDILVFDQIEESFEQVLRSGGEIELGKFLQVLFQNISNKKITIEDLKLFIVEMVLYLFKLSRMYGFSINWIDQKIDVFKEVEKLNSLIALERLVLENALEVQQKITLTRKNSIKILIESAVTYLEKNYNDATITLDSVASQLHISPEYLSRQFSKEMDETFIHYLTKLRLDAAKRMIEDSNLKNFQIAESVGYNEANYFSYVYKKHYGISPSKYRKSIRS